jgi:hypothetical protein
MNNITQKFELHPLVPTQSIGTRQCGVYFE